MYKHKASIVGRGGRVIGHTRKDGVRSVAVSRDGVRVDKRKGMRIIWFWCKPFRTVRQLISE